MNKMTYILIGILIIGGIVFLYTNQKNNGINQKTEIKAEQKALMLKSLNYGGITSILFV